MDSNNNHNKITDRILGKIRARELTMRPRAYFLLHVAALALVSLAAFSVSIFILNFILFSVRLNSHDILLGWGPRGILVFLRFFPWWLLLFDVALVIVLVQLMRHFRFGYRSPAVYVLLGLFAIIGIAALAIDRGTDVNDRLLRSADENRLISPFEEVYGHARRPLPPGSGVCRCTIMSIAGNTLMVKDARGTTTLSVILPPDDPRATTTSLRVGDTVLVAGDRENGIIRAFGVRKIRADWDDRVLHQGLRLVK